MKPIFLLIFILSSCQIFSQLEFEKEYLLRTNLSSNFGDRYGDIDLDGDIDMLSTSPNSNDAKGLEWFENLNGKGIFGKSHRISAARGFTYLEDMEGDGDLDIICLHDQEMYWLENICNTGDFITKHLITEEYVTLYYIPGDVDNDGDLDIVTLSHWIENDNGEFSVREHNLDISSLNFHKLEIKDINGDGLNDIVLLGRFITNQWAKSNGNGFSSFENIVGIGLRSLFHDLDKDGDADLFTFDLANSNQQFLHYFKNNSNSFREEFQIALPNIGQNVNNPGMVDFDLDGDEDLYYNKSAGFYLHFNNDGNFEQFEFFPNLRSDLVADVDGDKKPDIIFRGSWFKQISLDNIDPKINQIALKFNYIIANELIESDFIEGEQFEYFIKFRNQLYTINKTDDGFYPEFKLLKWLTIEGFDYKDFNNDGANDLLISIASSGDSVLLFIQDQHQFEQEIFIDTQNLSIIKSLDYNLDGNFDFIGLSEQNELLLYENYTNLNFSAPTILFQNIEYFDLIDLNNDDQKDLVYLSKQVTGDYKMTIAFINNTNFETLEIIHTFNNIPELKFKDLNNDGYIDIISNNPIGYFKNDTLTRNFEPFVEILSADKLKVYPIDISVNGTIDFLYVDNSDENNVIIGYLEQEEDGSFQSTQILDQFHESIDDLLVVDYDEDQDLDILIFSANEINLLNNRGIVITVPEDTLLQNILVYPNPFSEELIFEVKEQSCAYVSEWRLFDLHGSLLKTGVLNSSNNTINTLALTRGTFILQILNENGDVTSSIKLIKLGP